MKKYPMFLWLAGFFLVLMSGCRTIETDRQLAIKRDQLDKAEPWRYEFEQAKVEPEKPAFPVVRSKRLANGLTIMVVEDHHLPIASINFVMKNGSAKDPHGKSGVMHLTGQMLKEGTEQMTSLELADAFANLGTEVNINVGKDTLSVTSAVLSDQVEKVITLFSSMLMTPRMAQEDFDRVKMQLHSALASYQGVLSYLAQTKFLLAAYGDKHPYSTPSAGTMATVAKLSLKDIKATHQTNFGAGISALIAVGDVTLEQIEAIAKAQFGKWKKEASTFTSIADPRPIKQMQTRLIDKAHSPQTYLLIGQPFIKRNDLDIATLEVLVNILAGLPTSRLDAKLREEKGWTYGVSSGANPLLGKGPVMIATSIQIPYGSDALGIILAEFERLRNEPITEAELNTAKNGLLHSFANRFSTVDKIASSVAEQFVYSLSLNHYETIYNRIAKVSTSDVKNMANRALKKDHLVAIAVGDLSAIEAPINKINVGKVEIERENQTAVPPKTNPTNK